MTACVDENRQHGESLRPNFLIVVADDLGYSDLGIYGGEIETPNLDSLAQQGLMFTNYYVAGTCSPTRSMLMTGVDHHRAGIGAMAVHIADNQLGMPGYEGFLNDHVLTIAERLKSANYHTFMTGKWHLGETEEQSPVARGFDQSYILINGGASHFDQSGLHAKYNPATYRDNGKSVQLSDDFSYSTDFYTNETISYLKSIEGSSDPFFAYLAYTAPHWPLQAPEEDIAEYQGKYDSGWQSIRDARLKRQKEMGLVPETATLSSLSSVISSWEDLSEEDRLYAAKRMEIYAAMVDRLDRKLGELIAYLKVSGQFENTVIVFMSDNGSEGAPLDAGPPFSTWMQNFDNSVENIGSASSYIFLGEQWAVVGNTPNRLYKGMTTDGGIRVPGFIHYPQANNQASKYDGLVSVLDIVPTILDLAGLDEMDTEIEGRELHELQGKSWLGLLNSSNAQVRNDDEGLGWELFNKMGYRRGNWKAVKLVEPQGSGDWELFNLATDPGEVKNLSKEFPEVLGSLISAWEQYAVDNGVVVGNEKPYR